MREDSVGANHFETLAVALRRGALFEAAMRQLQGAERRAMGSIKETLFTADLPAEDAEAMAVLMAVKDEVLTPHGETDA